MHQKKLCRYFRSSKKQNKKISTSGCLQSTQHLRRSSKSRAGLCAALGEKSAQNERSRSSVARGENDDFDVFTSRAKFRMGKQAAERARVFVLVFAVFVPLPLNVI